MDDLVLADGTELARRIRTREVSPVEVVDAFLEQIDRVNPTVNAYCFVVHDQARAAAQEAERQLASGVQVGPLHGVPIAFKDLTITKGIETTFGSWVFRGNVPDADAIIVERTKAAGAIVIGKTQTPEFAYSGLTRNLVFGATHNPWDLERTSGGSSGGAAAAVAAAMAPFAEGTDGGGSVRIPASCCGVFGLKPQFGRIPCAILESYWESLLNFGPITWSVRDAALLLSVWAGPDDRDPHSLPSTGDDFVAALSAAPSTRPRVAYSPDFGVPVDPAVRTVVDRGVHVLEAIGCDVETVAITGMPAAKAAWDRLWWGMFAGLFAKHVHEHGERMTSYLLEILRRGEQMSATDYVQAQVLRSRWYDEIQAILDRYDFFVAPTIAVPPPSVHSFSFGPEEVDGQQIDPYNGWVLTAPFNLSMHPAASIPAGFTPDGLPVGMQIVSRRYQESSLLHLAARFEEAAPWGHTRPPAALLGGGSATEPAADGSRSAR